MHRIRTWLPVSALLLFALACRALAPGAVTPTMVPSLPPASPSITQTVQPPAITDVPDRPRVDLQTSPTEAPTLAVSPTPEPSPTADQPVEPDYTVRLHPDGPLFVGDQVSLEVIAPQGADLEDQRVQVQVDTVPSVTLGPVEFGEFGIGRREQATLLWAWDTSGLPPGEYHLTFSITPGDLEWIETVSLFPAEQVPAPEPEARWAHAEGEYSLVYYITGSAAARDIDQLIDMIDELARQVSRQLNTEITDPIQVTFLPRVMGHGGFASDEISVSYLDRNYMGEGIEQVLHHEIVHLLDGRLAGDLRPTMLVEGLAVYLSGGHFKPEPLSPRAAALLEPQPGCVPAGQATSMAEILCGLDLYIPLPALVDDFYFSQHEIGYLEAGALVEYMVNTWGWEDFMAFYRDIHPVENGGQSDALDSALQAHFQLTLNGLDQRFRHHLRSYELTPALVEDTRLTVAMYDTARRYQQLLDPSAYFLTAWLPGNDQMRERGIVADYLRRPSQPENLALEELLTAAQAELRQGNYAATQRLLSASAAALDALQSPG